MDVHVSQDEVRLPVLKRLAEQSMSDEVFRKAAAADLEAALAEYGYELTSKELELVQMFRTTLAEANIDVQLVKNMDLDSFFDDTLPEDLPDLLSPGN